MAEKTIEEKRAALEAEERSKAKPRELTAAEKRAAMEALSADELARLQEGSHVPNPNQEIFDGKPVVEKQHPLVSDEDRKLIKRYGGSPEDTIVYLKGKNPDMQFGYTGGRLVMRMPKETEWGVIDPSEPELKDISDVTVDVAKGLGSTAASVAGGLAGAPTIFGALPSAMLAGGTAGTLLEAARQKTGIETGVRQGYDLGDIAISGITDAATPLAFGSGATPAQQLLKLSNQTYAKGILSRFGEHVGEGALSNEQKELARQLLANTQRGLMRYAPEAMQIAGGTPATTTHKAMKPVAAPLAARLGLPPNATNMQAVAAIDKGGASAIVEHVTDDVAAKLWQVKRGLQKNIDGTLGQIPEVIDSMEHARPFIEEIAKLRQMRKPDESILNQIAELEDIVDELFYYNARVPKVNSKGEVVGHITVRKPRGLIGGPEAMELKQALKDKTENFANVEGKKQLSKRTIRLANESYAGLGQRLNDEMAGLGLDSKTLLDQYSDHLDIERMILPVFDNPSKAFNTMRDMDNMRRTLLAQAVRKVDKKYGTSIGDTVDTLEVYSTFNNPSYNAISQKGTTSTSLSGGAPELAGAVAYTGGKHALGPDAGVVSRALAKMGTSFAVSPMAVKQGLKLRQAVDPAISAATWANQLPGTGSVAVSQKMLNAINLNAPANLQLPSFTRGAFSIWPNMYRNGGDQ